MDPEFREIWENLPKDKKTKFRNETQEFRGMDLRAKMIEVCSQEIQSGTYMDSDDLARKYRNNPVLLESILTNAKRLLCPTRGIWVYEDRSPPEGLAHSCVCPNCKCIINADRQYQSRNNAQESHTKKRTHEVISEDTTRGKPKAKRARKANASGPGVADPNQLDPEQESTPSEWTVFMIMSEGKLIKLKQEIDQLGPWIPQVAKDGRDVLEILLQDVKKAGFDPITGEVMDFSNFKAFMYSFEKMFKRRIAEIENLVEAAEASRSKSSQMSIRRAARMARQRMLEVTATYNACDTI